jgi:oligosaccharide repeat unit polymerase
MDSALATRRSGGMGLISIHYFIIVLLLVSAVAYRVISPPPSSDLIYALSLALLSLTIWTLWSWRAMTRSIFDIYVMFFLAAVLFNGGHALLEVFRLNPDGILGGQFPDQIIVASLFMVLLALASFHMGALIVARRARQKVTPLRRPPPASDDGSARYLRLIGWTLLLISAVPAYLVTQEALRISIEQGYFALYQQESLTGSEALTQLVAKFLTPGALFLLAGSKGRPLSIAASAFMIVAYTVANIIVGSRIEAAAPLLAYVWLWHRQIRPLPAPILVASALILFGIIFPLVQATRDLTEGAKLNVGTLAETFASTDNPLLAIISEMGHSQMTVAHTIQLVPEARSYDFGLGYAYAMLTVFPNLFWEIHPTVEHGLAASWLVNTVSPSLASIGGGYGYSFIAEAYLNFGWIGITLFLGLFGAVFALVVLWAQRTADPAGLAMAATLGAFIMIFARGESGSIVRELVWYAFGPFFAIQFMKFAGRSRR